MKTLQFTAQCMTPQAVADTRAAQQQVTRLLTEKLAQYGFEALSQSGGQIAVMVEQHELPLSVSCEAEEGNSQHLVCSITSYPEEEQDWLERITEQSLLNQLAQAVEQSLKEEQHYSQFEWK